MGYTTDFYGRFNLDRPLTEAHATYLSRFSETRRMARDPKAVESLPDPAREAVGLPIGPEGDFYVGEVGSSERIGVPNYNKWPSSQHELWCEWVPTEDNLGIEWNGAEKFYKYTEWLNYLVENFLKPWGYKLTGKIQYKGEGPDDAGWLAIVDGVAQKFPNVSSLPEGL